MNLRHALAQHGFESNEDYEFALRCLFEAEIEHLRVLHVAGEGGRRKTAFIMALAEALGYPHVLYHDFSRPEPPPPPPPPGGEETLPGTDEAPLCAFERAITEACAYSEGARTLLILDQLQAADFTDQIRLHHFIRSGEWNQGTASVMAHPRQLLIALLSEAPLYHPLARVSFRIWTDARHAFLDYRPEDYGLGPDAKALFAALSALFQSAALSPTPSEFSRLLQDLLQRVRSEEQLRQALFGRIEGAERACLDAAAQRKPLTAVIDALGAWLGQDRIELG